MLTLYLMATTYRQRPSEIVGIADDDWTAYQFDAAVMAVGLEARSGRSSKGRNTLPDDPQLLNGDWGALARLQNG